MAYQKNQTRESMERSGWDFGDAKPKPCRACQEPIAWATSPQGKHISFNFGTTDFHVKTCSGRPAAKPANTPAPAANYQQRAPARPAPSPAAATPASATGDLQRSIDALTGEIQALISTLQARRASQPAPPPRPRVDEDGCPC